MALDKATVARIAHLARIRVPEEDLEPLTAELARILTWVEQLAEVDTENVEPLRKVMDIPAHWREDVVTDGGRPEQILMNAPRRHDGYFVVPKVVE
jgi:aspartyl-tRNA(Asn)/glutamyl-tRNA(Gln) amidotransferase subunit C